MTGGTCLIVDNIHANPDKRAAPGTFDIEGAT